MTIDETKYLMEAFENVKERDRIIECNTIDRVLEIIKVRKQSLAYDNSKDYRLACDDIELLVLALKDGDQE